MNDDYTKIANPEYYYSKAKGKTDWNIGDLKHLVEFIKKGYFEGKIRKVLEIGCGTGEAINFLPREVSYTGIDPVEYSIREAKIKFPECDFVIAQAENLPFSDNLFDFIFSHQVLEMLFEPKRGLREMMRVARPGGYVAIIAPNLELPWSELHATRHYSKLKHLTLFTQRFTDLLIRLFGKLRFRIIDQSYTEATGKFEKSDDDLKYITSSYEVATFFKRHGFIELARKDISYPNNSLKNFLKNTITGIPILRYYNSGMFFIFRKFSKNDF